MKTKVPWATAVIALLMAFGLPLSHLGQAVAVAETDITEPDDFTLTVLSPQGPVNKSKELAPRLKTLAGKTIAMWLSATPDHVYAGKGAELYDELIRMLKNRFPDITIVPYSDLPMKFAPSGEVAEAIEAKQPDGVVAGFGG